MIIMDLQFLIKQTGSPRKGSKLKAQDDIISVSELGRGEVFGFPESAKRRVAKVKFPGGFLMGTTIETGDTVTFNYEGKVEDGSTFHTFDEEPLIVELGAGVLIKGLEDELLGMSVGEEKTFQVTPENGYGVENPDMVQLLDSKLFADAGMNPEPGMVLKTPHGNCHVTRVLEDKVEISYNHPLAGRTLDYNVKIINVSKK